MTVYVDSIKHYRATKLRNKHWSHLMADTHVELMAMAEQLHLKPEWLQQAGEPTEHFDVTPNKRSMALALGAVSISDEELVALVNERRGAVEA